MNAKKCSLLIVALLGGAALWYFYPVFTFRGSYEGAFSDGSGKIKVTIRDKYYDRSFLDDNGEPLPVEFEYKVSPFRRLLLVDVGIRSPKTNEIEYYPVSLGYGEISFREIKGETVWLRKVD